MTFVTFMLVHVIPGDPARTYAGLTATKAEIAAARVTLGLNKPLLTQFIGYFVGLLHGNMGTSAFTHRPIAQDVASVLPWTIELVVAALVVDVVFGVPLGILAAVRPDGLFDASVRVVSMVSLGMPVFWLGLILQLVFGGLLGWFPISGAISPSVPPVHPITGFVTVDAALEGNWAALLSSLYYLVLPSVALAAGFVGVIARVVRSSMTAVLATEYIAFARSKGVSGLRLVVAHAFRNAARPAITILGMQVGWMLGSTVLVESVFDRPGIGSYAVTAVFQGDLWAVIGVVLVIGTGFVISNFVADLVSLWASPEWRLEVAHQGRG